MGVTLEMRGGRLLVVSPQEGSTTGGYAQGLRVGDVVQVDAGTVEGLPPNTPEAMRPLLGGVIPGEGRLLFVLDADRALGVLLDQVEGA